MRYGVTMVDECKQGTPTSNMHMNKWNEHISHVEKGEHTVPSLSTFILLSEICIYVIYDNYIEGVPIEIKL